MSFLKDFDFVKLFKKMPKAVKIGTAGILATAMVVATIVGAMALTFGPQESYLMTPGSTEEGQLILYDLATSDPVVTENDPFLDFIRESQQDDTYIIDYRVTIPDKVDIDLYDIPVSANDGEANTTIRVAVQRKAIVGIVNFFEQRFIRNLVISLIFILVFLLLVLQYRRYLKRKMPFGTIITSLLILTLIMGGLVLLTQTNLIWKHPGTDFHQKITLQEDEQVIGSMRIIRDENTPGAADWVTFQESNTSYIFFTLEEYEYRTFILDIQLPDALNPGGYRYAVQVNPLDGEGEIIEKSFRVS